jgi:hypothetical protein
MKKGILSKKAKDGSAVPGQTAIIQPKLMVNSPGDRYEQEADAMAERVMRMSLNQNQTKPGSGMIARSIQRKSAGSKQNGGFSVDEMPLMRKSENGGGFQAPQGLVLQLENSKGSGRPLPEGTRSFMENAFSADFSRVRVHTDSQAAEMNKGIQAKAFTHGRDIYFNSGQYEPHSKEGQGLLAHELAHTVQQADQRNILQLKREGSIVTKYGEWFPKMFLLVNSKVDPEKDPAKKTPQGHYGANMWLFFIPNDNVDAKQIGIIQTAYGKAPKGTDPKGFFQNDSGNLFKDKRLEKRATKEGTFIDQNYKAVNPLYASTGEPGKKGMGDAPLQLEDPKDPTNKHTYGRHGEHYFENGKLHHKPADIYDTPTVEDVVNPKNFVFKFETTALALEGKDKGIYYGSVTWGWELDNSGVHKKIPLSVRNEGAPSNSFIQAAKKWNKSKGGKNQNEETQKLPVNVYKLNVDVIAPTESYFPNIVLKKGTRVQIKEDSYFSKNLLFSHLNPSKPLYRDVDIKVAEGSYVGIETRVSMSSLILEQ